MPHRWLAQEGAESRAPSRCCATPTHCRSRTKPGLVVLRTRSSWRRDPHLTLAEVERVLVPEAAW